jgi:predicted metal-binding membrane protein
VTPAKCEQRCASRPAALDSTSGWSDLRSVRTTLWVLGLVVAGWAALTWLIVDMGHPLAQLTMPETRAWHAENLVAITIMWAVMMAAMMLPSALPMVQTLANARTAQGGTARWQSFVLAYLLVWAAFSAAATGVQWALQAAGWVDPMIVSRSAVLTGLLLVIAGIYQLTPLKRVCLAHCRSPLGFVLGEWRGGVRGSFLMGLRYGLLCLGCCWALMALLFVGGVMNLYWIAALSLVVAVEKLAPHGDRLGLLLGNVLIAAGVWRMLTLTH